MPAPADRKMRPIAARYQAKLSAGDLVPDRGQLAIVEALDDLTEQLIEKRLSRKNSALGWLFSQRSQNKQAVKGLYIWGDVGRGKTMLMDLFFSLINVRKKQRVHFAEFMRDVHGRIAAFRAANKKSDKTDPVLHVAAALADETWLLCFDEFTVTDITTAMILSRLFTALFERGVVVVATSNIHPDDLYKNGQNREHLLPFIALLQDQCDVLRLQSRTDYRLGRLTGEKVYWTPLNAASKAGLDAVWRDLTETDEGRPDHVHVTGRKVAICQAEKGVARLPFADLCDQPLGANDYLAIAETYHTLLIDDVPCFGPTTRNQARRFVMLIDALYNAKTRLVLSAEAPPDALYTGDVGTASFEFSRTASRLHEMQAADYLDQLTA